MNVLDTTQLLIPFATVTKVSNSPLSAKIKGRMLDEMHHALVGRQVTWYHKMKYTQLLRDLRVYYSMLRRLVACFRHSVRKGRDEGTRTVEKRERTRKNGGRPTPPTPQIPSSCSTIFRARFHFARPDQLRAWKRLGVWRL